MENKFKELDIENGFALSQVESLNYLDYVIRERLESILAGEEDREGFAEIVDDICTMKEEIAKNDYAFVEFLYMPACASGIGYAPLIRDTELDKAISDVAEWIVDNLDDPTPLIFRDEKTQGLLESIVRIRRK